MIFDQVGTPTNASDLAKTCLDILLDKSSENISLKEKFIIILMKELLLGMILQRLLWSLGHLTVK